MREQEPTAGQYKTSVELTVEGRARFPANFDVLAREVRGYADVYGLDLGDGNVRAALAAITLVCLEWAASQQGAAQEREFDPKTDAMILYAFRYCLGRATYATADCADYLIANWDRLSQHTRGMVLNEIARAFGEKRYGHDTDREEWERVLTYSFPARA
jgi:hypothetical protein